MKKNANVYVNSKLWQQKFYHVNNGKLLKILKFRFRRHCLNNASFKGQGTVTIMHLTLSQRFPK